MTRRRRLLRGVGRAMSAVLLLMVCVVVWPHQLGGRVGFDVVAGQSMEPGMRTGDLVLTWRDGHYEPGAVVVYQVPDGEPGAGAHVVHRVVSGSSQDGLVTRGDNNAAVDVWTPTGDDVVGRVVVHVRSAGWGLVWVRHPLLLSAVAAALVSAAMWPRRDEAGRDEAARDEPVPLGSTPTT